ncbi:MAG: DUF1801 domain-containing protein [Pseudomonadota bacterium]
MAEAKTVPTGSEVADFIAEVEPKAKREDAKVLLEIFERVTGEAAKMWPGSIIGFGEYRTTYASGRKVHCQKSGFATRKAKHSLHLMGGYVDEAAGKERVQLLAALGKHSEGASCLYINKLSDVDLSVLEQVIAADWETMNRVYPD